MQTASGKNSESRLWTFNWGILVKSFIVLFALSYSIYIVTAAIASSPEQRIQYVPDDAFYYMTLARNHATQGQWSFDSGESLTSGFHLLHGYLLSSFYKIFDPDLEGYVLIAVLYSSLLLIPTFILGVVFIFRSGHLFPAILFLLFVLSRNVAINSISALEWTWVVTISSIYCLLVLIPVKNASRSSLIPIFGCAFIGSLARSDFGLLPAMIAASSLIYALVANARRHLGRCFVGLGGAILGFFAVILHSRITSGEYFQSSVRIKSYWGSFSDPSFKAIGYYLFSLFGPPTLMTQIFAVLLVVTIVFLGIRLFIFPKKPEYQTGHEKPDSIVGILWLGCLLTVLGYILLYAQYWVGVQTWYTANLIAPLFILLSLPIMYAKRKGGFSFVSLFLAVILVVFQLPTAFSFFQSPEYPHQVSMQKAGNYLRTNPLTNGFKIGSWNAGIIGYYQGGEIINLDGLVNNDIINYVPTDELPRYIDEKSIRYLIDFENTFYNQTMRSIGGYDDHQFLSRLHPMVRFDMRNTGWRRLTLFELKPAQVNEGDDLGQTIGNR